MTIYDSPVQGTNYTAHKRTLEGRGRSEVVLLPIDRCPMLEGAVLLAADSVLAMLVLHPLPNVIYVYETNQFAKGYFFHLQLIDKTLKKLAFLENITL